MSQSKWIEDFLSAMEKYYTGEFTEVDQLVEELIRIESKLSPDVEVPLDEQDLLDEFRSLVESQGSKKPLSEKAIMKSLSNLAKIVAQDDEESEDDEDTLGPMWD